MRIEGAWRLRTIPPGESLQTGQFNELITVVNGLVARWELLVALAEKDSSLHKTLQAIEAAAAMETNHTR